MSGFTRLHALRFGAVFLAQKFTRQGYDSAQLRKSTDAIDNYDAALRLNPESAELFYRKARAFGDQFKYDLALVEIKKAIELDPIQYSIVIMPMLTGFWQSVRTGIKLLLIGINTLLGSLMTAVPIFNGVVLICTRVTCAQP